MTNVEPNYKYFMKWPKGTKLKILFNLKSTFITTNKLDHHQNL